MPFNRKLLPSLLTAGLVLVWPTGGVADSIGDTDDTVFGSGMTYVPPADLTGWFFDSDAPPAFPVAPDPSQPWTSAANIATLNYWLGVVSDLGDDPVALEQLYTAGMIDAPTAGALTYSQTQAENPVAPEPAGAALLGAGLLVIGIVAEARRRRIRRYP
jgi:hypothetical protein